MKKLSCCYMGILLILGMSGASFAGENQHYDPADSWIANGDEVLGKGWWLKNAKKFSPMPKPLLYHFDLTYSYAEMGGNFNAENHTGSLNIGLRKSAFTSFTNYNVSKSKRCS